MKEKWRAKGSEEDQEECGWTVSRDGPTKRSYAEGVRDAQDRTLWRAMTADLLRADSTISMNESIQKSLYEFFIEKVAKTRKRF